MMRQIMTRIALVGMLVCLMISGVVFAQDDTLTVTATTQNNLNVRAEPRVGGELVGVLAAESTVEVKQRHYNKQNELWLLIPFEDDEA